MADYRLVIIGGGLSGLAAAIRYARYFPDVLVLEQHIRAGGLNSYYYRQGRLFETGLHAITNFAPPEDKNAPLNRLLRQLKIKREQLALHPQIRSEIRFFDRYTLSFSNDFAELTECIRKEFPQALPGFLRFYQNLPEIDPFTPSPFRSARQFLQSHIDDPVLVDMLLCPLLFYGSSMENDMDLSQFAIMFRAIFLEGLCRPMGTIKDLLDMLLAHYLSLGGAIRYQAKVAKIIHGNQQANGLLLENGETINCDAIISTVGYRETLSLLGHQLPEDEKRIGFVETIFQFPVENAVDFPHDITNIFYNNSSPFKYAAPKNIVDMNSGVLCFPMNFAGNRLAETGNGPQLRITHLANYQLWADMAKDQEAYQREKFRISHQSFIEAEKILGQLPKNPAYEDMFTPVTIARFTSKHAGAVYGSAKKIKDGNIGFKNLYLAGTDQGLLGIVGSMISGVSIINRYILPKL
ncbi:MAG TPA: NAD(P)/FAD-dependent oxidoreductase [Desulfobulbaceae bacterium]|nr:NAD(P)/FAD-dependent oxidoreductase [Desulfobulbaceae bacterium]